MTANREIIANIFSETAKGNGRPFVEAMDDSVAWRIIGSTSWSGTFTGKQAVLRDLLGPLGERLEGRNICVPTRIVADGDIVVVQARGENRTRDGKDYRNDYCFVIAMKHGRITMVEEYCDTRLVAEALGELKRAAG